MMYIYSNRFHRLLLGSTAILLVSMGATSSAFAAFDPNADALPAASVPSGLPDTGVLYNAGTQPQSVTIPQPMQPLYPTRSIPPAALLAPVPTGAPAAPMPVAGTTPQSGFIAPAPVFAAPVPTPLTNGMVPSVAIASPPAAEGLDTQTKAILSHIPSQIDTTKIKPSKAIAVNRVSPDVNEVLGKDAKVSAYESVGISIKVRRPGLDANYELNRAYVALMGGDTEGAIHIYKDILSTEPGNQDALFGLATTYHRLGDIDKARPLYGVLLKINPNHRDGLNNFLALVSDESPQEALAELERLEQRNPDFSPIPAQQAVVLSKMGYADRAREKMLRAIDLAPTNLTYKYNLAVMLDGHGDYADAGALYRLLIKASSEGQQVPSSIDEMQKRLNYITTAAAEPRRMTGG